MNLPDVPRRDIVSGLKHPNEVQTVGELEPHYDASFDVLETAKKFIDDERIEQHLWNYVSEWTGYNAVIQEILGDSDYEGSDASIVAQGYRKLFPQAIDDFSFNKVVDRTMALREGVDTGSYLIGRHPFNTPKVPTVSKRGWEPGNPPVRQAEASEAITHVSSELGRRFAAIMALDVVLASPKQLDWFNPSYKRQLVRGFQYDFVSNLFNTAEDVAWLTGSRGRITVGDHPSFGTVELPNAASLAVSTLYEAGHILLEKTADYRDGFTLVRPAIEAGRYSREAVYAHDPYLDMTREFIASSAIIANRLTPAFRDRHDAYVEEIGKLEEQDGTRSNQLRLARDEAGEALATLDEAYIEIGSELLDRFETRIAVLENNFHDRDKRSELPDEVKAELGELGELVAAFGLPANIRSSATFEIITRPLLERIEALTGTPLEESSYLQQLQREDNYEISRTMNRRHHRHWHPGDHSDPTNR